MSEREPPEYCNKRMRPGSGRGAGNSCNPAGVPGVRFVHPRLIFVAWLISPLGRNVTVL